MPSWADFASWDANRAPEPDLHPNLGPNFTLQLRSPTSPSAVSPFSRCIHSLSAATFTLKLLIPIRKAPSATPYTYLICFHLWISTTNDPQAFASTLYHSIHAPSLQCSGYYINSAAFANGGWLVSTDGIPLSFVEKAPNLTKLEMNRFFSPPSNIADVLKGVSQHALTHLTLTCQFGMGPFLSGLPGMSDPFDLESLVVRVDDPILDISDASPLLPHLEVFELYKTQVPDDLVLRFVISRMNTQSRVAVLKKVKITFDRITEQDGLDVANEIRIHAEKAGIRIDTNFEYAVAESESQEQWVVARNSLSPSFIRPNSKNNDHT